MSQYKVPTGVEDMPLLLLNYVGPCRVKVQNKHNQDSQEEKLKNTIKNKKSRKQLGRRGNKPPSVAQS